MIVPSCAGDGRRIATSAPWAPDPRRAVLTALPVKRALAPTLAALLAACAAAAPAPSRPAQVATASPPVAEPPPIAASSAAPVVTAPEPAPAACADGMVLVDGEYCTELEMKCLRSTYAPQNKKTICHAFAEPTVCVGPKVHKRYCIDAYEYPNRKGERPRVMMRFGEAQALCAAEGKRVCTETEWTMACEGPSYKPYPYGYARDPSACNGDRTYLFPDMEKIGSRDPKLRDAEVERQWQGVPSGSQPRCVSDYGVYDMPGNADELASSETPPPRSKFDNVTTGGPWLDGVRNQCRPKIYTHDEGFYYYYLSLRCCSEPDGAPTDPRAPKQIRRGKPWKGPRRGG